MDQETTRPTSSSNTTADLTEVESLHQDANQELPEAGTRMASVPFNIRDTVNEVLIHYQNVLAGEEDARGIPTGFRGLDRMILGLRPGEMSVIAARPSMGKTSLMLNIAEHVCIDQKVPTLIFSGDENPFRLVQRIIFSRARYALIHLYCKTPPNKSDLLSLRKAAIEIAESKLFIVSSSGLYMDEMRSIANRYKRENNIGFIAIDQLDHLKSNSAQAERSHEREVAEVSSGIKSLAKELGVPILVVAALNRKPEYRNGSLLGFPRLSDLRASGAIENDADMVGLLYRPGYYAEAAEDREIQASKAEFIIAKNRNGNTGHIPLTFINEQMRFEDFEYPMESMETD